MAFNQFFAGWENDRMEKRFYQIVTAVITLILLVAVYGLVQVSMNAKVILVPATLEKSVWVTASLASDDYYGEMANFFANYRLNYSPQSVDYAFDRLMRYVAPEANGILSAELKNLSIEVKQKNYSSWFLMMEVLAVNPQARTYKIKGTERHYVGSQMVEESVKEYLITFRQVNGKIFVESFRDARTTKTAIRQ
ncbi:MAG: TraE/TraK family type IV conjugative transfer system protein [Nitrospiria bacterium]